ncbi:MAG: type II toxin-antitoxin system VapC family toxin [Dehalococcoidia bacterium]
MRVLLDTQAFLYSIAESSRLPQLARSVIENLENEVLLSLASVWEMAIKVGLGKLTLAEPLDEMIPRQVEVATIVLLPITVAHATTVATLPLHHRDPFDRMLVAQSMVEGIPLISGDIAFDQYPIQRLW